MAAIQINDIRPAGSELFADPEGFINDLGNDETTQIIGGFSAFSNCDGSKTTIFSHCGAAFMAE